jgi:hypothetical protein
MFVMAHMLRKCIYAGAAIVVLTGAAVAQSASVGDSGMVFSPFKQPDKPAPTQDEIDKQRKLDEAYKSATNKIPDQRANDPWAVVRPTAPAPAAKKKQQ